MNDPNKAISVNLSSLLSLKAELLRKQHEVKLAKAAQGPAGEHKPQKVVTEKEKTKSHSYKEVSRNEDAKVYETEDHAQLEKSRRVLEAKSKYYDRMSRSGGNLNSDDNCLVMFNRKRQEEDLDDDEPHACSPPGRVSSSSSSSSEDEGNDDDEVEYVDCLGRTRKCLRKVLAEEKKRDKQLAQSMPERIDTTKANWMIDTKGNQELDEELILKPRPPGSIFSDDQSTATHHAEQLLHWERKEQENAEKPDVHYQDVFFDEARTHGVGYYAFSTDEDERAKQQRELEEARKATTEEQTRRDELRAKRDSMVAGRVLAAKNRIRARSGLPPISKEDYERELQQKKDESAAEAVERERKEREKKEAIEKEKEEEEAERAELRKEHVRDWDKEKLAEESDEEWEYKAERLPMSQEEWNEKQRAERKKEFAPLSEPPKRSNFSSIPEPPPLWDIQEQEFSNFNSSKQQQQFQRRNYTSPNEDIDDDIPSTSAGSRGAAIPPPPGLNDMGPPPSKVPRSQNELERSIEAGLKFLRNCCDKEAVTNKATWTAKADY